MKDFLEMKNVLKEEYNNKVYVELFAAKSREKSSDIFDSIQSKKNDNEKCESIKRAFFEMQMSIEIASAFSGKISNPQETVEKAMHYMGEALGYLMAALKSLTITSCECNLTSYLDVIWIRKSLDKLLRNGMKEEFVEQFKDRLHTYVAEIKKPSEAQKNMIVKLTAIFS